MKTSYKLFTVRGIDVRIHITLLILFLLPVMQLAEDGLGTVLYSFSFILILFGSVLMHELSHSFVAMRSGIKVREITLWIFGGMASIPSFGDAKRELKISIAGPVMSLVIGLLISAGLVAAIGFDNLAEQVGPDFISEPSLLNLAVVAAYINFILGFFNLFVPIFPMDGGRVLRSLLNIFMSKLTATRIAFAIGQVLLAMLVFVGIMAGSLWIIGLGIFLFVLSLSELKMVEMTAVAERVDMKKIMKTDFIVVSPELGVGDLKEVAVGWQSIYPVLSKKGKPLGIVNMNSLEKSTGRVSEVMERELPIIRLEGDRGQLLVEVLSKGYGVVVDKKGVLEGIITMGDLQKAIQKKKS
jgi:Zn-dependent protease/predicted transcriptional regulator